MSALEVSSAAARPHVAVIDHLAERSGAQLAMARLATALREDVRFTFVLGREGPMEDVLRSAGHEVVVRPLAALGETRIADISPLKTTVQHSGVLGQLIPSLAVDLRRRKVDVVYTNSLKAHIYGGFAAKLARLPWVLHFRDILQPPYVSPEVRRGLRIFLTVARPAALIANSTPTAQFAPTRRPAHVIPSGIERRPRLAGLPTGPPILGVMGRIVEWKGQDVAVRALPEIRKHVPGVRLLVAGDAAHGSAEYADRLNLMVEQLELQDVVEMVGYQADPYDFWTRCHVALHTSVLPEPFGQVVVEALAVGRPVVATAMGGPAEILTGVRAGKLIQPSDPAALAEAVVDVLQDQGQLDSLVESALDRAADFTLRASAAQTLRLLRQLGQAGET